MKIYVSIMGDSTQTVELPAGKTAGHAVTKAGYELSNISKIKRNSLVIPASTVLKDGDMILLIKEKMAGAVDGQVKLTFEVSQPDPDESLTFPEGATIFDFIKKVVKIQGYDIDDVTQVKNSKDKVVGIGDEIVDGEHYTLVINGEGKDVGEADEDIDYNDYD